MAVYVFQLAGISIVLEQHILFVQILMNIAVCLHHLIYAAADDVQLLDSAAVRGASVQLLNGVRNAFNRAVKPDAEQNRDDNANDYG